MMEQMLLTHVLPELNSQ